MSVGKQSNSRRNVLKAGVAVGVGAVAWSGPTITSLGGTPAYAAVCTQVATLRVNLISDTNTNKSCQGVGQLRYLTYQKNLSQTVPAKYNLNISDVLDKCANIGRTITWSVSPPPGSSVPTEKCKITFTVYNANGALIETNPIPTTLGSSRYTTSAAGTSGSLTMPPITTTEAANQRDQTTGVGMLAMSPSGRYGISMVCVPVGAQCYPDGIDF